MNRRPWWVLAIGLCVLVMAGVVATGTLNALSLSRFELPDSESVRARALLAERHHTGSPNLVLLVRAKAGTVDSPAVAAEGRRLAAELATVATDVGSYWTRGNLDTLRGEDRRSALVVAHLPGDVTTVRTKLLPDVEARFEKPNDAIEVTVAGADEVFRQAAAQARQDFIRAEMVIFPLVLILLVLVFRGLAPALLTLGTGVFAMVGTLAVLRGVAAVTEVSTFAANLALAMGLGLGIDYGLFVIARFREDRDVARARRTILYSATTVAISLAALLVFPFPFLRSFAYAGIAVVALGTVGAVVLLPAALTILARKDRRWLRPPATTEGFWYRTALAVMRRPILAGGAALLAVLVLGAPFTQVRFGLPDDRVLPPTASVRQVYDVVRAEYRAEEADAIQVVTTAAVTPERVADYAARLSRIPGAVRVDSVAGSFADGRALPTEDTKRFAHPDGTWLSVVVASERLADDTVGMVRQVRETPAPVRVVVGGYPAELADFRGGLLSRLPLVMGLILVTTFLVLWRMTRSPLLPVKATILNALSLSAMFGALVWVFQEGHGAAPLGSLEPSIPILMFCVAYGLSMDYEVFILSRIKEEHDAGADDRHAVAMGIQRSAPLVTAAAAILAVSFAAYAFSGVVFLQMLGLGIALAVIVDATLVRAVLVPAFMRLAGPANWWTPGSRRKRTQPHSTPRMAISSVSSGE